MYIWGCIHQPEDPPGPSSSVGRLVKPRAFAAASRPPAPRSSIFFVAALVPAAQRTLTPRHSTGHHRNGVGNARVEGRQLCNWQLTMHHTSLGRRDRKQYVPPWRIALQRTLWTQSCMALTKLQWSPSMDTTTLTLCVQAGHPYLIHLSQQLLVGRLELRLQLLGRAQVGQQLLQRRLAALQRHKRNSTVAAHGATSAPTS